MQERTSEFYNDITAFSASVDSSSPFGMDDVSEDEISELYTVAASRGDILFMRELRQERNMDISVDACRAVFLYAVDSQNVEMIWELGEAENTAEIFDNPKYVQHVSDVVCATNNDELIEAVNALPGMNG